MIKYANDYMKDHIIRGGLKRNFAFVVWTSFRDNGQFLSGFFIFRGLRIWFLSSSDPVYESYAHDSKTIYVYIFSYVRSVVWCFKSEASISCLVIGRVQKRKTFQDRPDGGLRSLLARNGHLNVYWWDRQHFLPFLGLCQGKTSIGNRLSCL